MKLLFFLGKSAELAKKEIEAAATILPFSYSTKILSAETLLLKSSDDFEFTWLDLIGSESEKRLNFLKSIYELQNALGGTVKIGMVVDELSDLGDFSEVESIFEGLLKDLINSGASGKLSFGVSVMGEPTNATLKHRDGAGFNLKKKIGAQGGVNLRYLMLDRGQSALSSAQVFHNKLSLLSARGDFRKHGIEFNLVPADSGVLVAVTLTVQNIESYSFRDFQVPKPDPVSGMLPPKLAQMMINLVEKPVIFDPFCGNGRVLMEASLMGKGCYGADNVLKKVTSTMENLVWTRKKYRLGSYEDLEKVNGLVWQADATSAEEGKLLVSALKRDGLNLSDVGIVAEPYLGRPMTGMLPENEVDDWLGELVGLYQAFFEAWKDSGVEKMVMVFPRIKVANSAVENQAGKGAQVGDVKGTVVGNVVGVQVGIPAGKQKTVSVFENLVDRMALLGYHSTVLGCYERPDSFVIREIVKINKI